MGKNSPQTFDRTQKLEEDLINHWKQASFDHHSQVPWFCLLLCHAYFNMISL